ncbi:MAG: GNAT family N-acetyltransferase, partial [Desulfuromonadaceae bacterium]|nr:GNAT family N-acetyltransferase [Desulfuromonadaceae bacterium]
MFRLDLRYTGILELGGVTAPDELLGQIRSVRRQEHRKCKGDGFTVESSSDIDIFDQLHLKTFERQGIERSELEGRLIRSITGATLESGMGELLFCRAPDREVASATLFLYDDRYGYYLFAANDPEYRKTGCGSFIMVENILRCFERRLIGVDFVGINSPQRGDFKTSFNARPVPYFITSWSKPDKPIMP